VLTLLTVGYPKDNKSTSVKKRKPVEGIFYREKWRGEIKAIGKGANQLRGFLCPGSLIYRKIYERIDNLSKQGRPL